MSVEAIDAVAQPLMDPSLLRDPVLTSDTLLRRGPGPVDWHPHSDRFAGYRVSELEGMRLHVFVGDSSGRLEQWSEPTFAASASQSSIMDRNFADAPAFSPDGTRLAVAGRAEGDAQPGIYVFSGPRQTTRLTRPFGAHRNPRWSPSGDHVAYVERQGGRDAIWIVEVSTGRARELVQASWNASAPEWSPDGRHVVCTVQDSGEDALCMRVAVVEVDTGAIDILTPGGRVHSRFPTWARTGDAVYVLSDQYGVDAVWRVTVSTGRMERVTPRRDHDVGEFSLAADEMSIAFVAVDRTDHQLWLLDLSTGAMRRLDDGPGVNRWPVFHPHPSHNLLWVRRETPTSPGEPVIHDLATGRVKALTPSWASLAVVTGRVEQVRFPSFDGQMVDGILYAPLHPPEGRPCPAILYVHGGPNGQHANGYWPLFHYLTTLGFVVLAPNCRGSTGYGREWMDANIHDWGVGDRRDWLAAVAYLRSLPYINGDAVGIWGRSYGGYSVVRGLALEPETFSAGIAHFGPVDLETFYEETSVRHLMLRNFGHPSRNAASYRRSSVSDDLARIQGPLLLLQGEADVGVPPDQMRAVRDALEDRQHPVWYVEYPREGHGFNEPEHVYHAAGSIRWFWTHHLAT